MYDWFMSQPMPAAAEVVEISDYRHPGGWMNSAHVRANQVCAQLERGAILLLPGIPYDFPQASIDFLLHHRAQDSRLHKNVSFRPGSDVMRGFGGESDDEQRVHAILRDYSRAVTDFAGRLLAPYANRWMLDYASFRPLEEAGRPLPLHKRNDLLHVDAFPSRPTRGGRILRVFTNIHPQKSRVWLAGAPFEPLAERYAKAAGLETFARKGAGAGWRALLGLPGSKRSAYDSFMLHFHDWMKENSDLQNGLERRRVEFPPNTTWLVYTDTVPHAVLSGQFALEQTLIVPVEAMVLPEVAPLRVLERLSGRAMA
jgi:hypothetical protein